MTEFCVSHVVAVGLQYAFHHLHCHIKAHHGIHTMPNLIRPQRKKSCSATLELDKAEVGCVFAIELILWLFCFRHLNGKIFSE